MLTRGMTVHNTRSNDYAVVVNPPLYMDCSRQWNVSVQIPGRRHTCMWFLPDVELADNPYKSLSVGDTIKCQTKRGREYLALVGYVGRTFKAIVIIVNGEPSVYRGLILAVMPATMRGR